MLGLLVVLSILTLFRFPLAERFKEDLSDGFVPFLVFSSRIQGSVRLLSHRFKGYYDLQAENTKLRKDLSELSARVTQVAELERENHNFRAMLDFKDRSELKLISARVIGRDPSNWWNTVQVDRGSLDGITRDMPVLTVEGLVGKTIEVTPNSARILLVVDENCKVSAWLEKSSKFGIVQGNALAGGGTPQCRMTFVDRSAEVKKNEQVFTSGLGGIFPKGILIGVVSSTAVETGSGMSTLYQDVVIRPSVDLSQIDEVFIGVGVKPTEKKKPARGSGGDFEKRHVVP
ncbi:MAG: rod shape-determining protein MreC [Verrucomicrobia bacterium]|nr:rod shape-determining protein MreC [Verrucomicrobiota bacterium]